MAAPRRAPGPSPHRAASWHSPVATSGDGELTRAVEAARARVDALEAEGEAAQRQARAPWDAKLAAARAEVARLEAEVKALAARAEALEDEALRVRLGAGGSGPTAWWARTVFVVVTCLGSTAWLVELHGPVALAAALALPAAFVVGRWWGRAVADERALRDQLEALQARARVLEARAQAGVDEAAVALEYQALLADLDARRAALLSRREALATDVARAEEVLGYALEQQAAEMGDEASPRHGSDTEQFVGWVVGLAGAALAVVVPALLGAGRPLVEQTLLAVGGLSVAVGVAARHAVRSGRGRRAR